MSTQPPIAIFTVYSWVKYNDGYHLDIHYVAGFNSEDAENRINKQVLDENSESYINTDTCVANHAEPDCRFYTTRHRNEVHSEKEYEQWVHSMTENYYDVIGEDWYRPKLRKIVK